MADRKDVLRAYFEDLWNQGDQAAGERLLAPNFVCHTADGRTLDRAAYLQLVTAARTALPDLRVEVAELIAEDDRVAARFTLRGTQRGVYMGVPPTGKSISALSICTYRLAGDQIVEKWLLADNLGMLQQLGVAPTPASAGR